MSYTEAKKLPVKDRRNMLFMYIGDKEKEKEAYEEAKNNSSTNGKKTLQGDELKNYLRQNDSPT